MLLAALFVVGSEAKAEMHTGLTIKSLYSAERAKDVEISYWYPTQTASPATAFGNGKIFEPVDVVVDASIAPGKYPIVLLSHGGLRSSFSHVGWIASELSKKGYVVIAPKPPEPQTLTAVESVNELSLRPADLTLGLSSLEQIDLLKDNVATDKVSGVGFFMGGTAMLSLLGAKIDADKYRASCLDEGINVDCHWYQQSGVDLQKLSNQALSAPVANNRLISAVVINPELTKVLDESSLETITRDVAVIHLSGHKRSALTPANALSKIPNVQVNEISTASQFSAFSLCTPKGEKILTAEGEGEICLEPAASSRHENHQAILKAILMALPKGGE
jgi:predicted dienelactone hydrolase